MRKIKKIERLKHEIAQLEREVIGWKDFAITICDNSEIITNAVSGTSAYIDSNGNIVADKPKEQSE